MYPARHQIIARAFRRGLGQHRGFDVHETLIVHEATHPAGNLGTGFQVTGLLGTTQIQIAILEALLFRVVLVEVERQRIGLVDDGQLVGKDFHRTGGHVLVDLRLGTGTYHTGHLNTELGTQ